MRRSEKLAISNAVFIKCFHLFNHPSSIHVGQIRFSPWKHLRNTTSKASKTHAGGTGKAAALYALPARVCGGKLVKGHAVKLLGPQTPGQAERGCIRCSAGAKKDYIKMTRNTF